MSKIVFFCIPAYGHINPTLGVVRELTGRGHEVWYYCYRNFQREIESAGARFVSCDDYDMEQKLTPKDAARVGKDMAFSTRILVDTTLALDDRVCGDMERLGPDCIVADSMAVWGKAAALKLRVPFVSSTTTFAFNKNSAKIMKQSAGELMGMLVSMPRIQRDIKRLREKGYPVKSILDIIQNDERTDTIVYTSPQFQPCADTFPKDKYAFVGPLVRPAEHPVTKEKEKLVYLSMGTVNNDMPDFYQSCITALGGIGYQVILSVGGLTDLGKFKVLPENISVFPHVDQMAVLAQADVFISHCGMNSVNESLYCQVPLVMYPQTSEQAGVAARVEQLGAGIRLEKGFAPEIRRCVERVLEEKSYLENARAVSKGFRECSGARGAADKILQVCSR